MKLLLPEVRVLLLANVSKNLNNFLFLMFQPNNMTDGGHKKLCAVTYPFLS